MKYIWVFLLLFLILATPPTWNQVDHIGGTLARIETKLDTLRERLP